MSVAVLLIGLCSLVVLFSLGSIQRGPSGLLYGSEITVKCKQAYYACGAPCRVKTAVARRDCVSPCVTKYKNCRDVPNYMKSVWIQK